MKKPFITKTVLATALTPLLATTLSLAPLTSANAQNVYRCGNEYTNKIKGRKDCQKVEDGNVTVIHGTRNYKQTTQNSTPARTTSGGAKPAGQTTERQFVQSPQQQKRDSDARAILEAELQRAKARQAELQKEYNNGEPDRLGSEKNYQKYLDRVADLKASISRNQADIEGIEREIQRFK